MLFAGLSQTGVRVLLIGTIIVVMMVMVVVAVVVGVVFFDYFL